MERATRLIRTRLDRTGIVLSGVCAVHCVLGIVLVSMLGLGGRVMLDPLFHEVGLVLAVIVGALSLGFGFRRHGQRWPLALGVIGLALMALAVMVHHGPQEAALTIVGVALVATAHIRNLRAAS